MVLRFLPSAVLQRVTPQGDLGSVAEFWAAGKLNVNVEDWDPP